MDNSVDLNTLSQKDIGDLCVFAIRYCHGRQSYAPDVCRKIVRKLLPNLSDDTVRILFEDCKFQANMNLWGDEKIDKPGWIRWRQEIEEEIKRRNKNGGGL